MKAAVLKAPHQPLSIEDAPTPSMGRGDALVRVAACGVCSTDLHFVHGTPTYKKPPLILGHEISGIVEEVGDEAATVRKGERVLVPPIIYCGRCRNCREGRDNVCENMLMVGSYVDGGFAEYISVPAHVLIKLPDSIPLHEGAIISDAVSTAFHAVKQRGEVRPGEWAAVFGCGGVGINVVQIAAASGALVIAVDVDERKLELARRLGAVEALDGRDPELAKKIRSLTGGGVDVAFEVVGRPAVMDGAFESVKVGGRMVVVGYSMENWNFRVGRLMFRELKLIGSFGCRSTDYSPLLRMFEKGRLRLNEIVTEKLRLEEINEALKRLEESRVVGRQVVII